MLTSFFFDHTGCLRLTFFDALPLWLGLALHYPGYLQYLL